MSDSELPHLNPFEVRVLGCLMEKQLLTPDVYPLTLNSLQSAANQKSSRDPVMALEPVDINRTLKSLEEKGLARRVFGSRTERFEHLAGKTFRLTAAQSAVMALLLLRGPQTLNELLTRTERMVNFGSAEAVREELDMLIGQRPPLVKEIGRAPGQREDRFAHLLAGDVDIGDIVVKTSSRAPASPAVAEQEERVRLLEEELAALKARLDAVGA